MTVIHNEREVQNHIGSIILSRNGKTRGTITGASARYCAACGRNHPCFLVTWEDGQKTKPCTRGVKQVSTGVLQIS